MTRFVPFQTDLFVTCSPAAAKAPAKEPLTELAEMLARLRQAERMPWPDAAGAMVEERRALGLAAMAGAEGGRLVTAILEETERLLSVAEAR